ncbi:helix-hairpin-helix domain-containing protein [Streptomyces sp. NPDC052496]|uniref:helix-hairpin-helix domain-containing protein n=1 Tax=Streptomyces sp. NPDC052496 TaxID=3154951 RepID=UPI00344AD6A2
MSTDRLSDEAAPEPTAPGPETAPEETATTVTPEAAGTEGAAGGAPGGAGADASTDAGTAEAGGAVDSGRVAADGDAEPEGTAAGTEPEGTTADADAEGTTASTHPDGTTAGTDADADRTAADAPTGAGDAAPGTAKDAPNSTPSSTANGTPNTIPEATPATGRASAPSAAALAAAVRAVESGERSADSFFTERSPRSGGAGAAAGARKPQGGVPAPAAGAQERGGPAGTPPQAAGPGRPTAAPGQDSAPGHTRPAPGGDGGSRPVPAPHTMAHPATTADLAPGLDGVRQVLTAGGAPEALAAKTAETLGERAAEALRADPWQLLAVPGVRPEQADGFARALLGPACEPDDARRAQALVGWLLEQAALAGHSALEAPALRAALAQRSVTDPDEALQTAIAEGAVLVFQDAVETPGAARPAAGDEDEEQPVRVLLGLDRFAMAEESVADGLARLLNTFEEPGDGDATSADDVEQAADSAPADASEDVPGQGGPSQPSDGVPGEGAPVRQPSAAAWDAAAAAAPSPSAAELVRAAARSGLVAHTGAEAARAEPAALIAAARALGLRACGATHTPDGRARLARHLAEAAGAYTGLAGAPAPGDAAEAAVTLSGLLAGREGPGRDADGALALDLLVVLDAPQLDLETAAMLVESLADGARLVLSGDPGMLWSAGPGRLFADVLAAHCCPQVASRTPDFGPVGELVSGIGIGELNQVEAPGKEVVIVPARDPGEAVHRTVQLVADSVPRAIGVPAEQTQVVTVGHGGAAGTRALNAALKERLNPGPGRFGGFDPGDRVAYSPAPGRTVTGTVTGADAAGLHLDCAGSPVVVPRERVSPETVRHGWAVTAHQAVGSRWPAVVAVLPGDAAKGLTRSWVYTAFSRAERHLSVVQGVDQALPRAVAEIPAKERTTRLRTLLQLHTVQATADALAG